MKSRSACLALLLLIVALACFGLCEIMGCTSGALNGIDRFIGGTGVQPTVIAAPATQGSTTRSSTQPNVYVTVQPTTQAAAVNLTVDASELAAKVAAAVALAYPPASPIAGIAALVFGLIGTVTAGLAGHQTAVASSAKNDAADAQDTADSAHAAIATAAPALQQVVTMIGQKVAPNSQVTPEIASLVGLLPQLLTVLNHPAAQAALVAPTKTAT